MVVMSHSAGSIRELLFGSRTPMQFLSVSVFTCWTSCPGLDLCLTCRSCFFSKASKAPGRTGVVFEFELNPGIFGCHLTGSLSSGSPVRCLRWLPLVCSWLNVCTPPSSGGKQPVPVGLLWSQQAAFVSPNSEMLQKATEWAGDCFLGSEP